MSGTLLIYLGAAMPLVWGVAHLFPTQTVVRGFGDLSVDNRRIITMEWLIEGVSLIFIALLTSVVTMLDPLHPISTAVYWLVVVMLNSLSLISLFTGFRIHFLPFRLCPFIFSGASIMILLGRYL